MRYTLELLDAMYNCTKMYKKYGADEIRRVVNEIIDGNYDTKIVRDYINIHTKMMSLIKKYPLDPPKPTHLL